MPEKKQGKFKMFLINRYKLSSLFLVIIILVLGYIFLIAPLSKRIQDKRIRFASLEQNLKQKEANVLVLKDLESEYNRIDKNKIEKIERMIPLGKDLPNLFIQLESLAKNSGFILSSVDANPIEKTADELLPDIGIIEIKIKLTGGNYQMFKKFLKEVENNLRILDITSINFPERMDSFNVTLKTYYLE